MFLTCASPEPHILLLAETPSPNQFILDLYISHTLCAIVEYFSLLWKVHCCPFSNPGVYIPPIQLELCNKCSFMFLLGALLEPHALVCICQWPCTVFIESDYTAISLYTLRICTIAESSFWNPSYFIVRSFSFLLPYKSCFVYSIQLNVKFLR